MNDIDEDTTKVVADLPYPTTVRQTHDALEAAGLLTRSYANDCAPVAARLLWEHLTALDNPQLEKWSKLTVGELVTLVARRGERFNDGELASVG